MWKVRGKERWMRRASWSMVERWAKWDIDQVSKAGEKTREWLSLLEIVLEIVLAHVELLFRLFLWAAVHKPEGQWFGRTSKCP